MSGRYGRTASNADSSDMIAADRDDDGLLCDVPEERSEDDDCALFLRQTMHAYGWAVPDYRGVPFDPRAGLTPVPVAFQAVLSSSASAGGGASGSDQRSRSPMRELSSQRDTTPNTSTASLSALSGATLLPLRRVVLLGNLDQRELEFMAEYTALEKALDEIVGSEGSSEGA